MAESETLALFAGNANPALAHDIARQLTTPLGRAYVGRFSDGEVNIEALLISADDTWATEWEHAVLGRNGQKLDTHNVFSYRFEGDRIAEMWMVCTAPAGSEAFWS